MKRWIFGGCSILVIGLAAFTLRLGCNAHLEVRVEQPGPMGWDEELVRSAAHRRLAAEMPEFEIWGAPRDNTKSNIRLWEYFAKAGLSVPRNYRQEIGDCTSFGAKNAINCLQAVQIALGQRAEYHEAYPPWIYGVSRVLVGKGQLSGDGSTGAWTAKAVSTYGVLAADAAGVPQYSGRIAKEWGRRGPPQEFFSIAKKTLVKTVALVRSAQDVCDAITSGYGVTIASNAGFGKMVEEDGRMVGKWTTSWGHQMSILGYDGSTGQRWFYVLNSWSSDWGPEPLQGEPPGGFWISWEDCDRICRQGDSWAYSAFTGFPRQDLPDNIFKQARPRQAMAWPHFAKDSLMLGIWICAIVGMLVLAGLILSRRRVALGLLIVFGLGGAVSAQEIDLFGGAKVAPCEQAIHFDCMPRQPKCEACEPIDLFASTEKAKPKKPDKADQKVKRKCLVFTASWCGPCKVAAQKRAERKLVAGKEYELIDIDKRPDLKAKYHVAAIPALVLLDANGNCIEHHVGPSYQAQKIVCWYYRAERRWFGSQRATAPAQPVCFGGRCYR